MNQPFSHAISRLTAGAPWHALLASQSDAPSVSGEAKKKKKKKKRGSSGSQALLVCENDLAACLSQEEQCRAQEATCRTYVIAACGDDPTCPVIVACCTHFATCDATGFLVCLENGGT